MSLSGSSSNKVLANMRDEEYNQGMKNPTATHPFAQARYADGTAYDILDGKLGSNGKWYVFPICADCGKRKSAKIHKAVQA